MAISNRNSKKKLIGNKFDPIYLNLELILTPIIMIIIYAFFRVGDIFIIRKNIPFLINDPSIYQFIRILDLFSLLVSLIFIVPMLINSKYIHKYLTIAIIFLLAFIGFDILSFYFYFERQIKNKNILFSLIFDELWFITLFILFFISVIQNNDIHYLNTGSDKVLINFKNNNNLINKSNIIKNNLKTK